MTFPVCLDHCQRRVVEHLEGPLLVMAPVGTGKTLVLSERARRAIEVQKVAPDRVLCVTFTNRAAREMSERLKAKTSSDVVHNVSLRTFHSLCAHILRCEAKVLGIPQDFAIYDEVDSTEILEQLGCVSDEAATLPHRVPLYPASYRYELYGPWEDSDEMLADDAADPAYEWQERWDERSLNRPSCRNSSWAPLASDAYRKVEDAKMRAAALDDLPMDSTLLTAYDTLEPDTRELARAYQSILADGHALDFSDLVLQTRLALHLYPAVRKRWENRYDFVQVDEVQDTHLAEYQILKILAGRKRNLALIGDLDQAIYSWRGVEPVEVVERFRREFAPITELTLTVNYRSTRLLLEAASSFARCFHTRFTNNRAAEGCEQGEHVEARMEPSDREEACLIAHGVAALTSRSSGFAPERIGVLTRTNKRARAISECFQAEGVPCVDVGQRQFFRMREIKDAVALLRLILDPFDAVSARRVLARLTPDSVAAVRQIVREGQPAGLRITDLVAGETSSDGDPLGPLLKAYAHGAVTVFDVETTGLSPAKDEIVEIAAVRLEKGQPAGELELVLRPTVPVGDSVAVHHLSDAYLRKHGEPPEKAMRCFLALATGSVLVAHNCSFDRTMLLCQARRLGGTVAEELLALRYYDTLDLARRFVTAGSYRLNDLAEMLKLKTRVSHGAKDDANCACELLAWLAPHVARGAVARVGLVTPHMRLIEHLGRQFDSWRRRAWRCRPPELLHGVIEDAGLRAYYAGDVERLARIDELETVLRKLDDVSSPSEVELARLVEHVTLAQSIDYLAGLEGKVPILTVHQAKGLEFDVVFLAGVVEDEFPSYLAIRDRRLEEEKRLFYVGLTRARKRLYITGHQSDDRGHRRAPSRFLSTLPYEPMTSVVSWWKAAAGPYPGEAVFALLKGLEDKDSHVRAAAARELGRIGPDAKDAVPALVKAMLREDHDVHVAAMEALDRIRPDAKDRVPALTQALLDNDACVRAAAARTLGKIGTEARDAVPALIKAMLREDRDMRLAAREALDRICPDIKDRVPALAEALWDKQGYVRAGAARELGRIGPGATETVPALVRALIASDRCVRTAADEALERICPDASGRVPVLAEGLRNGDRHVRLAAVQELRRIAPDTEGVVPTLAIALRDRDAGVRLAAAETLGWVGPDAKKIVSELAEAMCDEDSRVRAAVAEALGRIGPEARVVVPTLVNGLLDESRHVCMAAGEALHRILPGARKDVPALAGALRNKHVDVRTSAAEALSRLGPEGVSALARALWDKDGSVRSAATGVLDKVGLPAVPALARMLEDEDVRVCVAAARTLGRIGSDALQAAPALIRALSHGDGVVRSAAAEALRLVGPGAVSELARALRAADAYTRLAVARTLGAIGPDARAAVTALARALRDQDADVRLAAADALGGIGPGATKVLPVLTDVLRDEDRYVRAAAAEALLRIGPAEGEP